MRNNRVIEQVIHYLQTGQFSRGIIENEGLARARRSRAEQSLSG